MVGHDVAAPGGEMSMIRLGDRNTSRGIPSPRTGTARGRGLNAENQSSAHLSSREKYFLLTFPLIELQGGPICLGPRTIWKSPPIVNGPAHKNLLSRAFEEHRLRGSGETRRCSFRSVYILQTRHLLLFRRCGGASPRFFTAR